MKGLEAMTSFALSKDSTAKKIKILQLSKVVSGVFHATKKSP